MAEDPVPKGRRGPEGADPAASLDEVLMTLVIEQLFFLEHAPEGTVAPDAAERMTQEIAFQLGRVPPHELLPFVRFVRDQARQSPWPEERAFLEKLPAYLGWGDTAPDTTAP